MTHYITAMVRADELSGGDVAKINGTWSHIYGCYGSDDLDAVNDEFGDEEGDLFIRQTARDEHPEWFTEEN